MFNTQIKSVLCAVVLSWFGAAHLHAAPMLNFDVDASASSIDTAGLSLCNGCSVSTSLASGLDSEIFSLAQGDSYTFDFFDIYAYGPSSGFGAIGGVAEANLGFSTPLSDVSGTGLGGALWGRAFIFFGPYGGAGGLTFDILGQPDDVVLGNGSVFGVSYSTEAGVCGGKGCTLAQTVQATVTAKTVVAEPSTVALLGLGLLGLGAARRRF